MVSKYMHDSRCIPHIYLHSNFMRRIVEIEKIFEQVVAGVNYEIHGTFKIAGEIKKGIVSCWHRVWLQEPENLIIKLLPSTEN